MAKYEFTKDLETGNSLIDGEHRQILTAVNNLMDACSQGKGRDMIHSTKDFMVGYVAKHFADEEALQTKSAYPAYAAHRQFHESYKKQLGQVADEIDKNGAGIATLSKLNQVIGILVNHIRTEDKKMAQHVKNAGI